MADTDWPAFARDTLAALAACQNEEQTKFAGIVPFFEALGYDPACQKTFRAEAAAGLAQLSGGRADFAIFLDNDPAIVVECKSADVPLDRHAVQLARYMQSEQLKAAPLGVLTNGLEHRFFERIEAGQDLPEPFLILHLASMTSGEIDADQASFLEALQQSKFDPDDIAEHAKRHRIMKGMHAWWRKQLQNPSDDFCKMVLQKQGFGHVSKRLVESYQPVIANVFLRSVAMEVAKILPDIRKDRSGQQRLPASSASAGAITTQREYLVFQTCLIEVAQRCETPMERHHLKLIQHKDQLECFKIFVGGSRKGSLLKFFEASPGEKETFEFADGQVVHSIDEIAEPLMKNYRDVIANLAT